METNKKLNVREVVIVLIAVAAAVTGFYVYTGILDCGYHLIDDKDLFAYQQLFRERGLSGTIWANLNADFAISRFRLLYQPVRTLLTALFGTDFLLWRICFLVQTVLTLVFLYCTARNCRLSPLYGALYCGVCLIGKQSEVCWMLGTQELMGTMLLALLLFLLSCSPSGKRHGKGYWVSVGILTVLTAASKEAFVLFIPVLACMYLWLSINADDSDKSILLKVKQFVQEKRGYLIFLAFLFILFSAFVFYMLLGSQAGSLMGEADTSKIKTYLLNIWLSFYGDLAPYLLFGLIFMLMTFSHAERIEDRKALWAAVLGIVVVIAYLGVSQLGLHMKTGFGKRYLLPTVVGYGFLFVIVCGKVMSSWKYAKWAYAMVLLLFLHFRLGEAAVVARGFANDGHAVDAVLTYLAETAEEEDRIFVAMPYEQMEWTNAVCAWLVANGHEETYCTDYEEKYLKYVLTGGQNTEYMSDFKNFDILVTLDNSKYDNFLMGCGIDLDNYDCMIFDGGYYPYMVFVKK